jgi:soluble lytic murein transglycosylase-like protein
VARSDAIAHSLFSRAAEYGSEVAARLAGMVRAEPGAAASLPDCLVAKKKVRDTGPTPQVADPVAFVAPPNSPAHRKLVQAVIAQSREHKVDPRLVFAVMRAESNFDPGARSPKNAQGLMQLIPETAERFAVADILDPVQNVRGGVRYLRWLLSYFRGDVVLALAAYNAGEGAVDRFRGVPPYAETMAYVARIRALYPHDRHPFDPRVAEASPVVAATASAASPVAAASAAGPEIATPVRYFLGKIDTPLAQSNR